MKTTSLGLTLLLASSALLAQQYVISTIAGGAPPPTPIAALNASIGVPTAVTTDSIGNVYVTSLNCVFKLNHNGVITRVAGNSRAGYSGDGGPATSAQLYLPQHYHGGLAIDSVGNLYIADLGNNRVRKVSPAGIITTVAGNGTAGYSGDNGQATSAALSPDNVLVDTASNLYIADSFGHSIRKVSPAGIITTVAGNGNVGYSGDGGPATSAQFKAPQGLAVDSAGNLYIADYVDNRVRKVSPAGIITTVAGNGIAGYSGDNGQAISAQLSEPRDIAIDTTGNLYISDLGNVRVRKISPAGIITTVAGIGTQGYSGDGGPATGAQLSLAQGVAIDSIGNLYIADENEDRVRKVSPAGIIMTVAGNGTVGYSGDGGPATNAQLFNPQGVAVDMIGNLYVVDSFSQRIRKVSSTGVITTVVGGGTLCCESNVPATSAQLNFPTGVALDAVGNLYVADSDSVSKVTPAGIITTVAGNRIPGYSGDGGAATSAQLNSPTGLAVDSVGTLYITDSKNNRVRKVSPAGIITTVAGNGTQGYSGDGGPATNAQLFNPQGVAVDPADNLYIVDTYNNRIRQVSPTGIITTVAGNGIAGDSGDGGPATVAQLNAPNSIAVDMSANLYISDINNYRVRKVSSVGNITTIAGTARLGYSGDGGPATSAQLFFPDGVAVDRSGNIFVSDEINNAIRLLQPEVSALSINAVANAASSLPGAIAPGEIVVIYGAGLGPADLTLAHVGNDGFYDCQVAGTTVQVNGTCAPIIYTWATQVAAIVPYEVSGGTAQVSVSYQGQTTQSFSPNVGSAAPGVFTLDSSGKGQAAAVNQDGSINTAGTPAKVGDVISLYATGEGQTVPSGVDGKPATAPYPHPVLPVSVTIGGQTVSPKYAGGAPGEVAGLMQINVQIPTGIQTGNVPVVVQVGDASSQAGVTIAITGN